MSFQTLEAIATRSAVVRVNLLPGEFDEARAARRVRVGLGAGLLAVVGVAAAAFVLTLGHVAAAEDALAAEQARTADLHAAQEPYAEVPKVMARLAAAQDVQADVSRYDVPVYAYLDRLATGAPSDLSLTSVVLSVDPTTAAAEAGTGTDPLAVPGIGKVTVTGVTRTQTQVADWMDQVNGIEGFADARLTSSALDTVTGVLTFNGTVTLTDDALLSQQ